MNNPAIKRLAKELQEIQLFKRNEDTEDDCYDENCIEAAPLKVAFMISFLVLYLYFYLYLYL